jgi:alkanesulfonate monooxygenase SsuD/methylene tetrahydromethanopterin reductase-like flavin-dependent oxidoreductase (luciferase family)
MKVGLMVPVSNAFATPDYIAALGEGAEVRGFSSLWAPEHVVLFDQYESRYPYAENGRLLTRGDVGPLDPFAALAFLAARTKTIRLGTGICLVPQRKPLYTAKEVASLDWLSGGRVD